MISRTDNKIFDVIIIGSGLAGIYVALNLSKNLSILIVNKAKLKKSSTSYAQGGIAAVNSPSDSIEKHIEDTLNAGCFLNNQKVVKEVVQKAPQVVEDLINLGVEFKKTKRDFDLHKEAGHSEARIFNAGDSTGMQIMNSLFKQLEKRNNIKVIKNATLCNILKDDEVQGVQLLIKDCTQLENFFCSQALVLATGGCSSVYKYSSNPKNITGDGIALAHKIGANVNSLEFNQFHPTGIKFNDGSVKLVTEAIRGAGAYLINRQGNRYLENSPLKELAPRDIVSRETYKEMKKTTQNNVWLQVKHLNQSMLKQKFPYFMKNICLLGLDASKDDIPIMPIAHYTCGGVEVDLNGATNIGKLFALGECSYTGLHGANRLASNSLLECLVFAHNFANQINNANSKEFKPKIEPLNLSKCVNDNFAQEFFNNLTAELKNEMWDKAGIIKSKEGLNKLLQKINSIEDRFNTICNNQINNPIIEIQSLIQCAKLITQHSLAREESIGLHYVE